MGGREMPVFPVAMSLVASYMSAITVLGTPTEMYVFGTQYYLVAFSGILTYPATWSPNFKFKIKFSTTRHFSMKRK
jgi:Na+/proline symporter